MNFRKLLHLPFNRNRNIWYDFGLGKRAVREFLRAQQAVISSDNVKAVAEESKIKVTKESQISSPKDSRPGPKAVGFSVSRKRQDVRKYHFLAADHDFLTPSLRSRGQRL